MTLVHSHDGASRVFDRCRVSSVAHSCRAWPVSGVEQVDRRIVGDTSGASPRRGDRVGREQVGEAAALVGGQRSVFRAGRNDRGDIFEAFFGEMLPVSALSLLEQFVDRRRLGLVVITN